MRTSLNEIHLIEKYLFADLSKEESRNFNVRLSSDKLLRLNVLMQQQLYRLLLQYHRRTKKKEAEIVQRRLFEDPEHGAFQASIHKIFDTFQ